MNPALIAALIPLLEPALGMLGKLVAALIDEMRDEDQLDLQARVAFHVVKGIEDAHPEWPSDMKRQYALDAIQQATGLTASVCAALLELSVQRLRQERIGG